VRPYASAPVIATMVVVANQALAATADMSGPRTVAGIAGIAPTRNAGSMLGFAQGRLIWIAIALAGLVISVGLARAMSQRCDPTALGMLAGGAAANTIQRLTAHGVADYVAVGGRTGVVFNLADVALLAGAYLATRSLSRPARAGTE
jgi:lipoprotein signal peptidase